MGRSGTFCALVVSINRFKAEQMVDVFKTIITMRTQRPGLVANAVRYILPNCVTNHKSLVIVVGAIQIHS